MATMKVPDDPQKPRPQCDPGPNEVLVYHCLTYTATYVIAARVLGTDSSPLAFVVIFLAHMVVDWHKARKRYVKTVWLDQTLHILTLVPLIWLDWL